MLKKIISGGQPGVEIAALDAAIPRPSESSEWSGYNYITLTSLL